MSSKVPPDLKYAQTHEWVRLSGDTATVGITDHAQHELTDVVFVELPVPGRRVKAGEACAVVESVKTASDIYSPISGEIAEVNRAVVDQPGLAAPRILENRSHRSDRRSPITSRCPTPETGCEFTRARGDAGFISAVQYGPTHHARPAARL